jgi:regulatory protein
MDEYSSGRKNITSFTPQQALEKARYWCALQERCHQEMRYKLFSWGLKEEAASQIISQLIGDGFLNEERFARSFVRGKFRIKHWGRIKIVNELKKKKISAYCIRKGLEEIEEQEYMETLTKLFEKRKKEIKERNPWRRKAKIVYFLVSKGYEQGLVNEIYSTNEKIF